MKARNSIEIPRPRRAVVGRRLFVLVALAATLPATLPAFAQAPPSATAPRRAAWRDRLYVGGGVGVAFGDVGYVEVAPLVGYRLNPRVSVGLGLLYRRKNDDRFGNSTNTTDRGGNAFTRIEVYQPIFAHLEYEYIDYEYALSGGGSFGDSQSSVLAGAGFFQPVSAHAGFYGTALYNFSYDDGDLTSPYDSPWVYRAGFTFQF